MVAGGERNSTGKDFSARIYRTKLSEKQKIIFDDLERRIAKMGR